MASRRVGESGWCGVEQVKWKFRANKAAQRCSLLASPAEWCSMANAAEAMIHLAASLASVRAGEAPDSNQFIAALILINGLGWRLELYSKWTHAS